LEELLVSGWAWAQPREQTQEQAWAPEPVLEELLVPGWAWALLREQTEV
jgi:hypothetical protein